MLTGIHRREICDFPAVEKDELAFGCVDMSIWQEVRAVC